MQVTETKAAFAKSSSFFYMNFNVSERRDNLRRSTDNVLSVETNGDGWDLVIDVEGKNHSVTYTLVYCAATTGNHSIEGRIRDAYGYTKKANITFPEKTSTCLVVGIIHNELGLPVHMFRAITRGAHWMIDIEHFKFYP